MSSYSLTEALKHSRYRLQQASYVVHKSRSEPAGMMYIDTPAKPSQQHLPTRRRNDEIVSVPVRPWHSPLRVRAKPVPSDSPPSFSLEPIGARRNRLNNYCSLPQQQQSNYYPSSHFCQTESGPADDRRSVGTEICVSDTISQDPSVSEHYLCERSACISHSLNCSNSTRRPDGRRRQRSSRRQRAGDGVGGGGGGAGRHNQHHHQQSGKSRSLNQQLSAPSELHQEWPVIGRRLRGIGNRWAPQRDYPSAGAGGMRSARSNPSAFSVNANCMADQRSPSQMSERTEPEFGCEDLKVRRQWHDALSNGESATQVTATDEQTRSAELGSDLSALTLSRTEISSTAQVVEPRIRHQKILGMESLAEPSDTSSHGQLLQAVSYQQMQVNQMLSHLSHQQQQPPPQQPQQQQPQQPPQQYMNTGLVQAMSRYSGSQDQNHPNGRNSASPPLASRQEGSRITGRHNPISHNSSNSSFSLNQSELSSQESNTAREEAIPASDDLVHLSIISCSEAGTGTEEEATTAPGVDTEGEADEGESTLRAESDQLAVSVLAAEDAQQQRLASLGPRAGHQALGTALVAAEPASGKAVSLVVGQADATDKHGYHGGGVLESRRSSRFGRLKTPEICKRSFLSVLRHSIAQGHVSHRAKIKPNSALRSMAGN